MNYAEECELQYYPNKWTKRYNAQDVVAKHLEFIGKASICAKQSIPCNLNIPYGNKQAEKIDIFGTHLPDDAPIFVYLHGGFWQKCSKDVSSFMVRPLVKYGFKVIVVGYTLCPNTTVQNIVQETEAAIAKCLQYTAENNSKGLYLCGHSAGAHLMASLFQTFIGSLPIYDQHHIKKVLLICGIYDLTPLTYTSLNKALNLDYNSAKQVSPFFQHLQIQKDIDVYVIVGEIESPAFKEQSVLFHRKLVSLGFTSTFMLIDNMDHFNIVEHIGEENYEITRLLVKAL